MGDYQETVNVLQPHVGDQVQLTEKLLSRPPLRFIHDIVCVLNHKYHCFGAALGDGDFDYAVISDSKEAKLGFISKLVDYMASVLGRPIDVNPKKVISGSEVERTHAMLRDLVIVATSMATSGLQQQHAGGAPPPPPPQRELQGPGGVPPPPPPPSMESNQQQQPPPPPPPPPPPLHIQTSDDLNSPTTRGGNQQQQGGVPLRSQKTEQLLRDAGSFRARIDKYGLDLTSPQTGKQISQDIIKMLQETKNREVPPTKPTNMSPEQMENAVQRQIDAIKQVKLLIDENGPVLDGLIDAASGNDDLY